jgi:hypothetical protein
LRIARRLLAPSLAAALGLAGTLALAPGARADTIGTVANLTGFHQMVVDSADGYVFLSEGLPSSDLLAGLDTSSALVVADLSGNYVATIDGGDGVEGIALSTDGTTLYAALSSKGEVAAINIASIKSGQPSQSFYSVPSPDVPYGVAAQSGKLWVSSNYSPAIPGGLLGYYDLSAASPAYTPDPVGANWYSGPDLAADPSNAGLLVAADPGTTSTTALTVDAANGAVLGGPSALSLGAGPSPCEFEKQLAVIPGTQKFIIGCEEQGDYTFDASDLSGPASSLASTTALPNFAVSPDGSLAASLSATAVNVYRPDGTLMNVLPIGSPTLYPGEIVLPADLALSADASRLFIVLRDLDANAGNSYVLQTVDQPLITRSTVTLSALRFRRLPAPKDAVPESPRPQREQPLARRPRPPQHGIVDAHPLFAWHQAVTRAVAQAMAAVAGRWHRASSVAERAIKRPVLVRILDGVSLRDTPARPPLRLMYGNS